MGYVEMGAFLKVTTGGFLLPPKGSGTRVWGGWLPGEIALGAFFLGTGQMWDCTKWRQVRFQVGGEALAAGREGGRKGELPPYT